MKKQLITFICALTILSLTLTGCNTTLQIRMGKDATESKADESESDNSQNTESSASEDISANEKTYEDDENVSDFSTSEDETPYVDTADQTAPMPETDLSEADLLGYWSPDIQETEPRILHFYYDDGELRYEYYSILLGNGQGLSIANATTQFEFNKGKVVLNLTQGTCMCMVGDTDKSYIEFYLSDMQNGIIYDQEDGKIFNKCETE